MAGDRADLIFTGGPIHTVDANNTIAEGVAVSDGRILAVGSTASVEATADPTTRRFDLRGRSLTPGFIDAHHHFVGVGSATEAIDCKAPGMQSIATLKEEAARLDIPLSETLAIGDGANDLAMIGAAGLGIAYRAKPIVAEQADARIDHADLTAVLYFQGYRAEEFAA